MFFIKQLTVYVLVAILRIKFVQLTVQSIPSNRRIKKKKKQKQIQRCKLLLLPARTSLSYGEVWARRNVYSAPQGYYKCTATHGTPRGTHGGPRGVVQQIPKGGYNTQGGV